MFDQRDMDKLPVSVSEWITIHRRKAVKSKRHYDFLGDSK